MARIMNFIFWTVAGLFWICLFTLDSLHWTPFLICAACWIYLAFAAYKLGWYFDYDTEEDEDHA